MSRITIVSNGDPDTVVELLRADPDTDPEQHWTGTCTGCAWTLQGDNPAAWPGIPGSWYAYSTDDAVERAGQHVDSHPAPNPVVHRLHRLRGALRDVGWTAAARRVAALAADIQDGRTSPAAAPTALRELGLRGEPGDLVDRAAADIDDLTSR